MARESYRVSPIADQIGGGSYRGSKCRRARPRAELAPRDSKGRPWPHAMDSGDTSGSAEKLLLDLTLLLMKSGIWERDWNPTLRLPK